MNKKTLAYYQSLPYSIEIKQDMSDPAHPIWFAQAKELPGCLTESDTFDEAEVMIQDALAIWVQGSLDAGLPIPEPPPELAYMGFKQGWLEAMTGKTRPASELWDGIDTEFDQES